MALSQALDLAGSLGVVKNKTVLGVFVPWYTERHPGAEHIPPILTIHSRPLVRILDSPWFSGPDPTLPRGQGKQSELL